MRHIKQILLLISLCISLSAFASEEHSEDKADGFDPLELINHHISDSHEWQVISYSNSEGEEVSFSIPLPVILYVDGNLDVFMSSVFHHGENVVKRGDKYYALHHNKIYLTDEVGTIHYDDAHNIVNDCPLDVSITRNVASMFMSAVILLLLFISVARRYGKEPKAPKGVQSFIEPIIVFVRDDIGIAQIGKGKYERYMPYLLTVFFFIWINNLIGLVPFFPGGSNLTGNISVTMLLAIITYLVITLTASKSYWKHIFWMPGVPVPIRIMLSGIEFIGTLTKPFALMIRLMANITAGHIVILSLFSLIFVMKSYAIAPVSIVMALMMFMLELLVAALQAYIFTLLSALFIGMAVNEHEDH
nr:F0F1 ATP synthase subunit A [uncultured Carboxylicivirga sp.]